MKHFIFIFILVFLSACGAQHVSLRALPTPDNFKYVEIQTIPFKLASWQKITNPKGVYKIYIEGDGHAFNRHGFPTSNPTPQNDFWRRAAFNDSSENVIYLARPCQYVTDEKCAQTHWTTGRFSKEVIDSMAAAISQSTHNRPVILIGFSGGAQVAGLIAVKHTDLPVKKIITVAGNLDHQAWTAQKNLQPLSGSLDLNDYRTVFFKIPQIHYVGKKDKVIPPSLTQEFIRGHAPVIVVPQATHQKNWESILPRIWAEH